MIEYNNCCIACGEIIPEGRQICPQCERKYDKPSKEYQLPLVHKNKNRLLSWLKQYFN